MAIDRDCWILGNGFFYFVLSCTDVSLLFSPIIWLSAGGKLKVMAYLIEKAASAYVTEKAAAQKMSLEKLKVLYHEDEVVMGEVLASEKADGLTIEESFFLYILAQNWANGDEFSWACGGVEEEWVSLVEEARWSFQKNRSWEGFLTRLKPTVKDMMRRGITFSMEY